ncbi:MAG: amidohydrolase, partial [Fidelibacterota bacterium]
MMKSILLKKLGPILMATSLSMTQTTLFIHVNLPGEARPTAILCEQGRIRAIGEINVTADRIIDLHGGYLYPGFTDAHLHLLGLGESMEILDLVGTGTPDEIIAMVREEATRTSPGSWIHGRGWDQNDWPEIRLPDHEMLDRAAPDNPVLLSRIDGHAIWVNSAALVQAGIHRDTPDPPGGKIYRDEQGEPTGILVDNAADLIYRIIPEAGKQTRKRQLTKAIAYLNSLGITAVHDAGTSRETLDILKELEAEGQLPIRVYAMLNDDPEDYEPFLLNGPSVNDPRITVRAIKLYLDGALGSRGAALLEPYTDDPENSGLLVSDSATVEEKVRRF